MRKEEWTLKFEISGEIPEGASRTELTRYCLEKKKEYERKFNAHCVVSTTIISTPIKEAKCTKSAPSAEY